MPSAFAAVTLVLGEEEDEDEDEDDSDEEEEGEEEIGEEDEEDDFCLVRLFRKAERSGIKAWRFKGEEVEGELMGVSLEEEDAKEEEDDE